MTRKIDVGQALKKYATDTAHDEISKKLQAKKRIGKEQADEEAGKILSAAKGKGKGGNKKTKINPSKFQKQLSNGSWVDVKEVSFIESVMRRNEITLSELLNKLKNKKDVYYSSDWYAQIRLKPTPQQEEAKKKAILKSQEESIKYQQEEKKRQYERVGKYEKW